MNNLTKARMSVSQKQSEKCIRHREKLHQQLRLEENRKRMSAKCKMNCKKKAVQATNEVGGVFIFDSITTASVATGTSRSSIIKCCKGKQKKANGYIWKYRLLDFND